jgi:hypothetical protein
MKRFTTKAPRTPRFHQGKLLISWHAKISIIVFLGISWWSWRLGGEDFLGKP